MQSTKSTSPQDLALHDRVRDLDLNLIAVFDGLLRSHSVGTTAARLGITQSAASRSLARLRALFADPLFVKTNNKMLPTPKAEHLAPTVTQIMSLVRDSFLSELTFDPARARRSIGLALSDLAEIMLMPALYAIVKLEAPQCDLRTVPIGHENAGAELESGAVALLVHNVAPPCAEIMQQALFAEPFLVIAHKDARLKQSISAQEYASADHVVFSSGTAPQFLESFLQNQGIARNVRVHSPHMLAVPEMVSRSSGLIATVPAALARMYCERGLVKLLKSEFVLPAIHVQQYWHKRFDRDPLNIWLRSTMRRAVTRTGLGRRLAVMSDIHDGNSPS